MLDLVLAILSKNVVILKLRLKNILTKDKIKDKKSHIFKYLHFTTTCFNSYNSLSFKTIDKANSKFDLKIKEGLHINWRKSNLNHLALTLSL